MGQRNQDCDPMNPPADNHLLPMPAFLRELQTRIAELKWQTQQAFERVEIFGLVDLEAATKKLVLNQSRFCVLVYAGDEFSTEQRGQDLHVRSTHSVVCLITDQFIPDATEAQMGNATTPGVHELQRLVLGAVTGNLLPNPRGAFCRPIRSTPLVLALDGSSMPGRSALELDLEIVGGEIKSRTGIGPIL